MLILIVIKEITRLTIKSNFEFRVLIGGIILIRLLLLSQIECQLNWLRRSVGPTESMMSLMNGESSISYTNESLPINDEEFADQVDDNGHTLPETGDQVVFDDDEDQDEEEEDEFYAANPIDQKSDSQEEDIDVDFRIKKSDFKDFDDHEAMKTKNFYDRQPKVNLTSNSSQVNPPNGPKDRNLKNFSLSDSHNQIGESRQGQSSNVLLARCAIPLARTGGCITFSMVEWAAAKARRSLDFEAPSDLNSLEPSESTINSVGQLNEQTSRFLAQRFQLTRDEVNFGLEQIDVSQTSLWRSCPLIFRLQPRCPILSRYRSHTGQCNNLMAPYLGSSYMPFVRMLPPDYLDGVGFPRRASMSGRELPPARLLAINLHPEIDNPSSDHSTLFMSWGQLINHDLALASGARESTGHTGNCCKNRRAQNGFLASSVCMPIEIGVNDPVYAPLNITCHDFKRSIAGLRPSCSLGPRTQVNMITSFVDASFVYGSTSSTTRSLRAQKGGHLAMWNYFSRENLKPLLPAQVDSPDDECMGRRNGLYCFRSGDMRTNQQVQLVTLHTIHTRQHNRIAVALGRVNPHWSGERIYQESRHIHIAIVQHILLSEYLPALLGPKLCNQYNLTESTSGSYWDHYEPNLNPGVSQAFAAAAFRQGHTTVPSRVFRYNNLHEPRRVYQLRQLFRQPWPLFEPGAVDEFLLGMLDVPAQSWDPFVSSELSGHLLQLPRQRVGLDLVAINIQRGRDQGVAGYNAYRDWCGLKRVSSFDELAAYMSSGSAQTMSMLHETVDDIDLFTGGISEYPMASAQVGPTFACIIGRQFEAIRAGDRFWFESSMGPHAFTLEQLDSIKSVTLARLICANSDGVFTIQQMALHLPHPVMNPHELCNNLPDLDISLWFEPRQFTGR